MEQNKFESNNKYDDQYLLIKLLADIERIEFSYSAFLTPNLLLTEQLFLQIQNLSSKKT